MTALIDRRRGILLLVECWNAIDDLGAAFRASDRKLAELRDAAVAHGAGSELAVHMCWVVMASRRNRALVARYPSLFESRLPGSSRAWVGAFVDGSMPPVEAGLVWCSTDGRRLLEWRRRRP